MLEFAQKDSCRIVEKNMAALQEHYPELARKIIDSGPQLSAKVFRPGKNGGLPNILMDAQGEKILYYDAKDPMGYCRRYIDALDLKYAPAIVFMGFGLGYQVVTALNELAQNLEIQHMMIVEKDIDLFKSALAFTDFRQVIRHPKIKFFVGRQSGEFAVLFRKYFAEYPNVSGNFKSIKIVVMPAAHLVEGRYYQAVTDALRTGIQHFMQGLGNDPYDSLLGIEHTLANLKPMLQDPGIISFRNLFTGKPAIVVGAGPSLNKNIVRLKEASAKALIVCVDAALKPLLKAGIRPHFVTTTERTKGVVDFYTNLAGLEDIFYIFCAIGHPSLYHIYKGPKIIATRYQEFSDWLELDPGALSGSPLVGNFAFNIAEYLGCNPIIMVGQDLSFKSTGSTHVKGMVFGTLEVYREDMIAVESNYGDKLMTNRTFAEARGSLEMQIENFDGLCINATEGGARIKGALLLDLKTSLKRYCKDTFDSLSLLKQRWHLEKPDPQDMPAEIERIVAILDRTLADLNDVVIDCKKGLGRIEYFENNHEFIKEGKPDKAALNRLKPVQNELYHLREKIITNPSLKCLWQIFQTVHTSFEMKQSFFFDQFHSPAFAKLKAFLALKEWFCMMGQVALSTSDSIKRAKSQLIKYVI
ncbi:MAG: DUF115 domain-containing protein [Proteobacteria bacterium]|nr:DUF115 domain-containing protein [Pseudomonadota bacterium]